MATSPSSMSSGERSRLPMTRCVPSGMRCRATHRCSIYRSRFFTELEADMSTTRYEHKDLRGIGVIGALAAALLASACGDESSDPATHHSDESLLNAGSPYAAIAQAAPA